jgi:signal transduction histidine kinase
VDVFVQRSEDNLTMAIEDDGIGAPEEALRTVAGRYQTLGILGMQERAAALGGRLEVGRRLPSGTRVSLALPLTGGAER